MTEIKHFEPECALEGFGQISFETNKYLYTYNIYYIYNIYISFETNKNIYIFHQYINICKSFSEKKPLIFETQYLSREYHPAA